MYNTHIMENVVDPKNIVGKPSPEMTSALKHQDEIQAQIKDTQALKDIASMVTNVLGQGEYGLTMNGVEPQQAIDSLHTTTGVSVISLGRRFVYGEEPRLFMDKKGGLADWRDRFEREGHVFNAGERISVPAHVEVDKDGNIALVADDQDGRMADKFYPAQISNEARATLERYRGVAIGCVVEVQGLIERDFQLSDIHEYDVELEPEIVIPPINPTPEQVAKLPRGARVITEGKVLQVEVREEKDKLGLTQRNSYLAVETDDGRQITVPNWSDKLQYDDGILENMRGKSIQPGETIRITSYVHVDEKGKTIHSHYSRPYLVEPVTQRIDEYQALREQVGASVSRLSKLLAEQNFPDARQAFAELRTHELTQEESNQVIASLVGFSENERPIYDGHERRMYWAESLDKVYGTQIEGMTRQEFEAFAREVGTGRREQTGEHCDASYAFLIMHSNNYDSPTMLSVLSESVDERLKRLEGVADEHEVSFPESYMLEQSLGYLSSVKHPDATRKILEVARYAMSHKLYDKRMERGGDWGVPHKFLHLLWSATDDLKSSIRENPDNLSAIENLDELLAWQEELKPYPFCNTVVEYLQQVTDMFRIV